MTTGACVAGRGACMAGGVHGWGCVHGVANTMGYSQ